VFLVRGKGGFNKRLKQTKQRLTTRKWDEKGERRRREGEKCCMTEENTAEIDAMH